jgi:hypothetical protein
MRCVFAVLALAACVDGEVTSLADAGATGVMGGGGGRVESGGGSPTGGGGAAGGGGGVAQLPDAGQRLPCGGQPTWTDITTSQLATLGGRAAQSYPGGVSGVLVNRLTGDVTVHIVGFGLWRSANRGATWTRIDTQTLDLNGGRSENGWSLQIDQDDPRRLAVFTLDGTAGSTADGSTWQRWAESGWGRNWDFGAVDWSAAGAQTLFGVLHETSPRNLYLTSTNGGTAWTALDSNKVAPMVGVVDSTTLIATRVTGIERSTNLGASWTVVSSVTPLSHVALHFKGKLYLTTENGLLVSADQGQTWQAQGARIPNQRMYQGPFFGADERTMVVGVQDNDNAFGGTSAIYKTTDGAASWSKVVDVPRVTGMFPISLSWYGSFAWDPLSDTYYVSSMSNPALRLDCIP